MSVKKYLKFDSEKGYLDNKDDINYFATNQMRKVAFGKMLGDFDENGLYVINAKIVEELIKMPKVVVDIVEGADLIRSTVKADAFFHFILTVEDNKATFKLLEKMQYQSNRDFNTGLYSNINEYIIDEVIVPDKDFDRNALYQKYNISTEKNGDVLSIFDMDELGLALYYNIVEKLKVNYLVQNQMILNEKQLEVVEADYFEAVLSIFEEFKEFGGKVTNDVKKDLAEKHSFVIISKPFFQHTVNEILDSYIEQYMHELSPEQKEQFLIRLRDVKERYYQEFKKLLPIEIAQKAGVRFDANKIVEEGIIGGLAKEIVTKGYTSSDVRKLLIDESELQLSITKIKEMVKENEDICKRDNAKAKDITTNREKTTKFYDELEKENKVDILKPDATLIETTINKNDKDYKKGQEVSQVKGDNKEKNKKQVQGQRQQARGPQKQGQAQRPQAQKAQSAGKRDESQRVKKNEVSNQAQGQQTDSKPIYYGTGGTQNKTPNKETVFDELIENGEAQIAERIREGLKDIDAETTSVDTLIR